MRPEKIKVGLLIDNFIVAAWIYESLKRIIESDYAAITLIVKRISKPRGKKNLRNFNYLIYNLYRKIENKYIPVSPNAFLKKDITNLINNIPVLTIEPLRKKNRCIIKEEDLYY